VSLRPQLIDRPRWDRALAAVRAIYGALCTLEQAIVADADLRAELDLLPEEEELAMAHRAGASSPSSRLDSFFFDEIGYVEYNAEQPAGMAYGDELADVFDGLPVMTALRERFELQYQRTRDRQLEALLQAFREWGGGTGEPTIAIVDWSGLPTVFEFEIFQRFFATRGVRAVICEPGQLEFSSGVLRGPDGTAINLVYRRVLTSELVARPDAFAPLRQAYLTGAACVVNSFRAKLLHKKMSLALLSDDRFAPLYSPDELVAIERHVPWTRKVCECATTRHGRQIPDLVEHLLAHRRELVLKPNDEYGGKGVVLGWTVDEHDWEQAIKVALTQSYVVQEVVPVPRERYPVAVGNQIEVLDLAVDLDPYLFHGEVGGALVRLSSSALLNVTAGAGSVVPLYVVEGARN
jgi:uncharacterized circularly permuted ATP-grasp superfamily protein